MITAEVIFWTNDIKDFQVVLPFPPRIGEHISFPFGVVKCYDGTDYCEENYFKIVNVDWLYAEKLEIEELTFDKLLIHVNCP